MMLYIDGYVKLLFVSGWVEENKSVALSIV